MMDQEQDIYYVAEVFTWLLWHVNPAISKEQSFELVLEMLNKGMDKKSVKKYGSLINKTTKIVGPRGKEVH